VTSARRARPALASRAARLRPTGPAPGPDTHRTAGIRQGRAAIKEDRGLGVRRDAERNEATFREDAERLVASGIEGIPVLAYLLFLRNRR